MRPRVAFVALGCRANQADADGMAARVDGPFELVRDGEQADLVVVNTCAVTRDADATARQVVRRASRDHPFGRIVATGCYAELAPEALRALPGVAAVLGVRQQGAIRELLEGLSAGILRGSPYEDPGESASAAPGAVGRTRPLLKVQDGCDQRCAYCIVPRARGGSRSMPFEEALHRLEELGSRHAEVVLTGVHLGAYGLDLVPRRSLADLLRAAAELRRTTRVRLSSVEPGEFPVDALRDAAVSSLLCDHFHLPVQSGSARVLREMRRPYGPADFERIVGEIAALAPGACLGTDVLVGFPGERDADFRETVRLLERLPLAYLHVFPFSPRPGTPAAAMAGQVPAAVARARARELVELGARRWGAWLEGRTGQVVEVVVERVEGGIARGTAGCHAKVRWPASGELRGQAAWVRVEASDGLEWFGVAVGACAERRQARERRREA